MNVFGRSGRPARGVVLGASMVMVVALAGGAWWLATRSPPPAPAPDLDSVAFRPLPPRVIPPPPEPGTLMVFHGTPAAPAYLHGHDAEAGPKVAKPAVMTTAPGRVVVGGRTLEVSTTRARLLQTLEHVSGRPTPAPARATPVTAAALTHGLHTPALQTPPAAAAVLASRLRQADAAFARREGQSVDDLVAATVQLATFAGRTLQRTDVSVDLLEGYLLPYLAQTNLPPDQVGSAYDILTRCVMYYRAAGRTAELVWALKSLVALSTPDGQADQWHYELAEVYVKGKAPGLAAAELRAIQDPVHWPLTSTIGALEAQAKQPQTRR